MFAAGGFLFDVVSDLWRVEDGESCGRKVGNELVEELEEIASD